ncbi:MAG: acyltransferase, partial [Proteobacteria bacterium]|nr:acyltransferase [Pseudomonadota bacterium]
MLYRLVKLLIGVALREFFSKITVRGNPLEQGPTLVVGNHQNFALDSLLIALCFKRKLWGLGKATLFEIPLLGWILRSLGVSPLYRKMDDPSKLSKNTETFDAVAKLLGAGNAVMLFPEGISLGERVLQPI